MGTRVPAKTAVPPRTSEAIEIGDCMSERLPLGVEYGKSCPNDLSLAGQWSLGASTEFCLNY